MKKSLLTLALVALTTVASYAQGTIAFGNSALTRVLIRDAAGAPTRNAVAADGLIIGAFYGTAGSPADALGLAQGTAIIGGTAGVLVNAPSVFALAGTEGGQVVSLQIRAWSAAAGPDGWRLGAAGGAYGETKVAQVTLGPTAGPGAVIWQTASGTFETRFTPLIVTIPEPSTIALAVLGLGSLLLFRRRK